MDNKEVRKRNLGWLADQVGGPTALADKLDRTVVQVSQWRGGKGIGDRLARDIEAKLGRPHGWLDTPQWLNRSDAAETENKSRDTSGPGSHSARLDHAIITAAKRWVMAEEHLYGPYPHDALVDEVLAVYALMVENDGPLTAEQRDTRFESAKSRQEQEGAAGNERGSNQSVAGQ